MKRSEKEEIVSELNEMISRSKMIILTDFKGLDVEKANRLRGELREVSVEFRVAKNSLLKLASKGTDLESMDSFFVGPNALALSYDDPISHAKVLKNFSKNHPELKIKVGILNGEMIDNPQISSLASLPGREVLLGKLLCSFVSPISGLMGMLSGVLRQLVLVLEAMRIEKEKK